VTTAPPAPAVSLPLDPTALPTPGIRRRLACFVYEGVLLFGVWMAVGLVYGVLTRQTHALTGRHGLQAVMFVVLGLYFVYFWSRSGQTLAMQTWHIRLVTREGAPVSLLRAALRYLLAWLWFLPALLGWWLSGLKVGGGTFVALTAGVLTYAALARLHPQRQFWHDAVCGTRLVTWRPAKP
jgi:uncharacterized RDD family membrane protein YckC